MLQINLQNQLNQNKLHKIILKSIQDTLKINRSLKNKCKLSK
jgi:hypothetical protein